MSADATSNLTGAAIETRALTRGFRSAQAVSSVTLDVPRGSVFALLGVNGAGKSTLINMLVGHLRPTSGTLRILGRTPDRDPLEIRRSIGYVSENRYLYDWMTVSEIVGYTRSFHSNWDDAKSSDLLRRFGLIGAQRVGELSRGHRARLCLALALAYNPELIILDEPTSGLDPIARRDVIENVIREIGQEGRTVLFSSHLVGDVERIADWVAIMHAGKLILSAKLDDLMASFKRIRIPAGAWPDAEQFSGLLSRENRGGEEILILRESQPSVLETHGLQDKAEILPLGLEEIFVSVVQNAEMTGRKP